jgi:cob(I)alamin adenosyltransferase
MMDKLREFILPGTGLCDAAAHLCRTQCRKAERFLWYLDISDEKIGNLDLGRVKIDEKIMCWINRLSDYFFTLGRFLVELNDPKTLDLKETKNLDKCLIQTDTKLEQLDN